MTIWSKRWYHVKSAVMPVTIAKMEAVKVAGASVSFTIRRDAMSAYSRYLGVEKRLGAVVWEIDEVGMGPGEGSCLPGAFADAL